MEHIIGTLNSAPGCASSPLKLRLAGDMRPFLESLAAFARKWVPASGFT